MKQGVNLGSYRYAGPFVVLDAGNDVWRLSGETSGMQILLRGAGVKARSLFADAPRIESVALEWSRDLVIVTLALPGGATTLTALSATVHEPQPALYDKLPLAAFDADARKFWQRVFRLMRIPGGRFLLGLMTRRRRSP